MGDRNPSVLNNYVSYYGHENMFEQYEKLSVLLD